MPKDLAGRPIAITGASSGIGLATAIACAKAGMPVALGARRLDRLEQAAKTIHDLGGTAVAIELDVTGSDACADFFERTVSTFGSCYAVFANAGFGIEKPVHLTTDHELRDLFEVNFWGTLNTLRPAIAHMLERGAGHLLICSSSIGKIGIPCYGPYCATKGAQSLLGRAMRHELAPASIHVSTVHPVLTATEFASVSRGLSGVEQRMADRMPRGMVQPASRVADAIVRCLRRPRSEVWTSTSTRLAFALLNASPRIADFALGRFAASAGLRAPSPDHPQATP